MKRSQAICGSKRRGFKILFGLLAIVAVVLTLKIALFDDDGDISHEYCMEMLTLAGLDQYRDSFQIEQEICQETWIDAIVYLKLKVDVSRVSEMSETMRNYPQFRPEISDSVLPAWWKPSSSAVRIVYYTDVKSVSPITLAYIDVHGREASVYLAVIPF